MRKLEFNIPKKYLDDCVPAIQNWCFEGFSESRIRTTDESHIVIKYNDTTHTLTFEEFFVQKPLIRNMLLEMALLPTT